MTEPLTALERDAQAWVQDVHPHARHLIRTRDRAVELDPDAREALRIAALLHDIERAFPDPEKTWDTAISGADPAYNRWHQDRSADIAGSWLRDRGADAGLIDDVAGLIRVHEDGGWAEANVLQAADSLSFFDTMTGLTQQWAARGQADAATRKLQYTFDRIQIEPARKLGRPLLESSLAQLTASTSSPT